MPMSQAYKDRLFPVLDKITSPLRHSISHL